MMMMMMMMMNAADDADASRAGPSFYAF